MTFVLPPGENFAGPQDYDKWRVPVIQAYIAQVLMSNLSYQRPRAATNITHPDVLGRDLYGEVGLPFDPENAREVFARAGYANDQALSLKFISQDTEMHRALLNSMAATWRDVLGIEVELQFFDQDTYLEQLENHDFDLYFKGWIAEYNDPDGFLSTPFRYSNPKSTSKEFDEFFSMLDQATELVDKPDERQAIYIRAERFLNEEETLVIPVLHHYIEY